MKKFLIKLSIYFLTFTIFIIGVEVYLFNYPSTFQKKANYLKENFSSIQILFLGSSHIQNGINPEFIAEEGEVVNLAFGSQDINLDSKIVDKFITNLPNLKYLVLELGYQSLEYMNQSNYHRNPLYLRFYKINNFETKINLKNYSIFLSKPSLYITFFNPFRKSFEINRFGYNLTLLESHNRFKSLNYDENIIFNDSNNIFITRNKIENLENFKVNTFLFENMISKCNATGITPIIIIPPVYKSYYFHMKKAKKERRDNFIKKLKNKYPNIIVLDYEQDKRISVFHYKNEDHLNSMGAEKLSIILNDTLKAIKNLKKHPILLSN